MHHSKVRLVLLRALAVAGTLVILITSVTAQNQTVDPVAYFDENGRWYNGFTESWFHFFDIPPVEIRKSILLWEKVRGDIDSDKARSGFLQSGGETHEDYLSWSSNSGFVWLKVDKCAGGPMQIIRGRVRVIPEGIVLIPETVLGQTKGHEHHSSGLSEIKLISIDWMGSEFYVREEALSSFGDYVAGLGEFNGYGGLEMVLGSPFLVQYGPDTNDTDPKFELPVFPDGYTQFLKKPVRGRIVQVGKSVRRINKDSVDSDEMVTPLRLKLENHFGLRPKMHLFAVGVEQELMENFVVKSVTTQFAMVEHVRWVRKKSCRVTADDDCKDSPTIKLLPGLVLSTNGF